MSHEIYENDKIITVGEKAWHGLDDNRLAASLDDVANEILNFEVHTAPMYYPNPLTGEMMPTEKKVTYRMLTTSNGQPQHLKLGEVGAQYEVFQNRDFIEALRPIEESGLTSVETAGTLCNSRKGWVMFKLNEIEPVPGDRYDMYLAAFNSFDGSTATGFVKTCVRIVCDNTWRQALNNKTAKILSARHTKNVKVNFTEIRDAISLATQESYVTEEKLRRLSQICVQSEDQILKVVKVVFSQDLETAAARGENEKTVKARKSRVIDDIVHLFHAGRGQDLEYVAGTGLALFNAITEFTNHVSGADRKNASTADSRLNSVLFGPAAKINDRAYDAILALA